MINSEGLYWKIKDLADQIKDRFRQHGKIIPVKNSDGSISVGEYCIKKMPNTLYSITDRQGKILIDQINLPQTAIILANSLGLGQIPDNIIIEKDRKYGTAQFEEQLYNRALKRIKRDPDYFFIKASKFADSALKKEEYHRDIQRSFEKLSRLA